MNWAQIIAAIKMGLVASAESVANIANGTTKVGNADKLDGRSASEYALDEQIKNNSIWTELTSGFDLNNALGKYRTTSGAIVSSLKNMFRTVSWGELSVNWIPFVDGNAYGMQIVTWKNGTDLEIHCRMKHGSEWGIYYELATTADLTNYMPLTGGLVYNQLGVIADSATDTSFRQYNSVRNILQRVYSDGRFRLFDVTNDKIIIESTANGTNIFNGTASGNLPLTGGTINGQIFVDFSGIVPLQIKNTQAGSTYIQYANKDGVLGIIGFNEKDTPIFYKADWTKFYKLLHTGISAPVVVSTTAPADTTAVWIVPN